MSETQQNNDFKNNKNKKRVSYKHLKNMQYMEILENYLEYPQKNLKFKYASPHANDSESLSKTLEGGQSVKNISTTIKVDKTKFLSEVEKAEGWKQQFSRSQKFHNFLQTNLHYLPEHLWKKMKSFYQDSVLVGYTTKDDNVHFFVHSADTDEISWKLYNEIQNRYNMNVDNVRELLDKFDEKGIESWLTLRAKEYIK